MLNSATPLPGGIFLRVNHRTLSNSINTDLFRVRRAVVRRSDTTDVFAARISGLVGWLRIMRGFFFLQAAYAVRCSFCQSVLRLLRVISGEEHIYVPFARVALSGAETRPAKKLSVFPTTGI